VLVSTHLISEFEGLIDEFTIVDHGRDVLTLAADAARARFQKIYVRFPSDPGRLDFPGVRVLRRRDREMEVVCGGDSSGLLDQLRHRSPETLRTESLTLEEIFVSTVGSQQAVA
jgi:ABC-type multidrug transport system ATPase subunit